MVVQHVIPQVHTVPAVGNPTAWLNVNPGRVGDNPD